MSRLGVQILLPPTMTWIWVQIIEPGLPVVTDLSKTKQGSKSKEKYAKPFLS